ncbi:tetratricopeptide repeat protein [Algimonas porphyrae]|uniref:Tetratricopeptide repeat-containing protein n=1 Tax=Algimonas porphyrae TaxID=1128113 RepID=A0ABQ5V359_9PROT|nr:hypothetical protein [Algimonas porphyrae]GLQ21021.1 tetratricopeptide repeat-containing protein [Algimonas porphyrae]
MGKYTNADIKRIANAMRRQAADNPERPYALMIGAGCSKSAGIPLAGALVEEIKVTYRHEIERVLGTDCDDDYGACMAALSASEVRAVLKPYLDDAGVNWAHLGIACMIRAGYIGRVLTFNFDSVLARACGLLGLYPATYDFVTGVSTRTNFIVTPAILHLHGQGHGLALLNSAEETQEHAENLRPLLTDTLSRHPMLVAGYSGESDAVFNVLADVFDGEQRFCWAGHDTDCPEHVSTLLSKRVGSSEYIGEADADQFFVDLATELGCWPPKLFTNPYAHMLRELDPVIDYPGPDTDLLSETRTELEARAKEADAEQDTARDLLMKGDYQGVIDKLGEDPETEEDRHILGYALMRMANALNERIGPDFTSNDRKTMLALYDQASHYLTNDHTTFYNWGLALQTLAEQTQDEALFRECFEKYAKATDIKPDDHMAFNNWGLALQALAEQTQDEALFRESFDKYAKAVRIKPDKQETYYNWGNAIKALAMQTQDEALFRESFDKYAKATEIKPDDHMAYYNWGGVLLTAHELFKNSDYLDLAGPVLEKAKSLNPDDLYNFACLRTLQGREDDAMAALLHCQAAGKLPSLAHLQTDTDLDPLRERDDFKALLARLEK